MEFPSYLCQLDICLNFEIYVSPLKVTVLSNSYPFPMYLQSLLTWKQFNLFSNFLYLPYFFYFPQHG